MGKFLQFGPGQNQLPPPWENLNAEHDIRKRLRFETNSVSAILMEHVLEHVPFMAGLGFMQEALRVLEPGGVLRLSFPDLGRFLWYQLESGRIEFRTKEAERYAAELAAKKEGTQIEAAEPRDRARVAQLLIAAGWGHQCAWSRETCAGSLLALGFSKVVECEYGRGKIAGVDGHALSVGQIACDLESTILEATK